MKFSAIGEDTCDIKRLRRIWQVSVVSLTRTCLQMRGIKLVVLGENA
jgi:hypothetical protein